MKRAFAVGAACLSCVALRAGASRAQPSDRVVQAEALFDSARSDVARADYTHACPKFAESQKLDPAVGTLINLADCEEHLGHLTAAWQLWRQAVEELALDDPRRATVVGRRDAIDARVPRLTLRFAPGVPPGTTVRRDDVELPTSLMNVAVPVDPGEHVLETSAPGRVPARQTVRLVEGAREAVLLGVGTATPPAPSPSSSTAAADAPKAPATNDGATQRWLGWTAIGVGAIGIGVGAGTGLAAIGKKQEKEDGCFPANVCKPNGASANDAGRTFATISTVSFIAGGAFAAAGIYLVLTAPRSKTAIAPMAVGSGAGAIMMRSF
jgi:hypothetical protein